MKYNIIFLYSWAILKTKYRSFRSIFHLTQSPHNMPSVQQNKSCTGTTKYVICCWERVTTQGLSSHTATHNEPTLLDTTIQMFPFGWLVEPDGLIEKSWFAKNRSMLHWTVLHHYRDPTPGKIGERIHYIVLWFKTKTQKDFLIFYFFVKVIILYMFLVNYM